MSPQQSSEADIEREFIEMDILSEDKVRELTGTQDLSKVTELELVVDTTDEAVDRLGEMLPNLTHVLLVVPLLV
jgi:hypothetical protein